MILTDLVVVSSMHSTGKRHGVLKKRDLSTQVTQDNNATIFGELFVLKCLWWATVD